MPADPLDAYADAQPAPLAAVCHALRRALDAGLPDATAKVWHGGPVWFLEGNPVVGYWVRKDGVQLLFWSGQSFDEPALRPEGKFKAADVRIGSLAELPTEELPRWLDKARTIQWDYQNLAKRKGVLERRV